MVLYKFGHIDIVCSRAIYVGTSKITHTDALLYTHASDLWHGEGVHHKTGNNFSTQKMGNIVPVFKLRPAKVVVVDGIHTEEGSGGMHSCRYRSDRWLFSLEDTFCRSI